MAHTQRESGFGRGIFVSYFFTVCWVADCGYWWLSASRYAKRQRKLCIALHVFMLFITFNATVVFETGAVRWLSLIALAWLGYEWSIGAPSASRN